MLVLDLFFPRSRARARARERKRNKNRESSSRRVSRFRNSRTRSLVRRMMLARFRAAYHQLAAEKFLVVQFLHGALRFVHGQHLDEGESLRALVVAISYDLGVLDRADAVEELEQIALGRVERRVPDVKPGRRHFDRFRFTRRPRTRRLRTIPARMLCLRRSRRRFSAAGEKVHDPLQERFFYRSTRGRVLVAGAVSAAPSAGAAARTPAVPPRLIRCHIDPQVLPSC